MKMIAISDLHMDAVTMGQSRLHEVAAVLRKAMHHAIREKVDLFLCTGDVCDPDSGPVVLRIARELVDVAMSLAQARIRSAWVCGNHDVAGDGWTTSLDPLMGLEPHDLPHATPWVRVFSEAPGSMSFADGWRLVGLPYPTKSSGWGSSHEPLAKMRCSGEKLVVAGHLSIEGVVPGEEAGELARGRDVFWPTAEVDAMKPEIKLNGHYHRRHVTKGGIQIVGSAVALTFGEKREKGEEPGYLYIESGPRGALLRGRA